jgi:hypothetical protein
MRFSVGTDGGPHEKRPASLCCLPRSAASRLFKIVQPNHSVSEGDLILFAEISAPQRPLAACNGEQALHRVAGPHRTPPELTKDIAKNNCFKMSVIARLDRAIQ